MQATKTVSEEKNLNHSTTQNGFLYIWTKKPGSVGHVAIQLGGDVPKRSEQQSGIYRSIWPAKFPAIGLTTILPLQATLVTNLGEDEKNESYGVTSPPSPINIMFDLDPVSISKEKELVKPDYTYEIKNLNQQKMCSELKKFDQGVEKGEIRYQLFPNFNPLKYLHFKQVLKPFTKTQNSKEEINKTVDRYDCATFAHHILTAGGASLGKPTWSPTKFNSAIEKSPEHFVPFHEQHKNAG